MSINYSCSSCQKITIILLVFISIFLIIITPYITLSFLVLLGFTYFDELNLYFGKSNDSFKKVYPLLSHLIFGVILFFIWIPYLSGFSTKIDLAGSPIIRVTFKSLFFIFLFVIFTPFISSLIKEIFNDLFKKWCVGFNIFLFGIIVFLIIGKLVYNFQY